MLQTGSASDTKETEAVFSAVASAFGFCVQDEIMEVAINARRIVLIVFIVED